MLRRCPPPTFFVFVELCSTCREERKILQAFVTGKMREHLFLKLRPVANGDHGDLDHTKQFIGSSANRVGRFHPSRTRKPSVFPREDHVSHHRKPVTMRRWGNR